jgi:hypothetical protein
VEHAENVRNIIEERVAERFKVRENILVYNEQTFADIIDISEKGLSYRYLHNLGDNSRPVSRIDLFNSSNHVHLRNIPCHPVHTRDKAISSIHPTTVLRTCGVEFIRLDKTMLKQLKQFIESSRLED